MAGCCNHNAQFDGVSREYKRRLWAVIVINAAMFFVEMAAGQAAKRLNADSGLSTAAAATGKAAAELPGE